MPASAAMRKKDKEGYKEAVKNWGTTWINTARDMLRRGGES